MDFSGTGNLWLSRIGSVAKPSARLVCFPYAGGGTSAFTGWRKLLPSSIDLYSVQLPGRENRFSEAPVSDFGEVCSEVVKAVSSLSGNLPTLFFGHSLGATIAFEAARMLTDKQCLPAHLIVSGRKSPRLPRRQWNIADLPDEAFIEELRVLNCTPAEVLENDELMRLVTPRLRADFALADHYRYVTRQPLTCPITMYVGDDDPFVTPEEATLWEEETLGPTRRRVFAGDHFFIGTALNDVIEDIIQTVDRVVFPESARLAI